MEGRFRFQEALCALADSSLFYGQNIRNFGMISRTTQVACLTATKLFLKVNLVTLSIWHII